MSFADGVRLVRLKRVQYKTAPLFGGAVFILALISLADFLWLQVLHSGV